MRKGSQKNQARVEGCAPLHTDPLSILGEFAFGMWPALTLALSLSDVSRDGPPN